jgi:hypothetical protein
MYRGLIHLMWVAGVAVPWATVATGGLAEEGKPAAATEPAAKKPAKRRPLVTVSKETTFITGPLRKDGTVDYVAALNERSSRGVTPENNAVVLLLKAVARAEIDSKSRERFFKMLGIAPLPEKGSYLESYDAYFERKNPGATAPKEGQGPDLSKKRWDESYRIGERPWSKSEFPVAAAWLEENQKQVDLVVAATKRPRFYVPLVVPPDKPETLISVDLIAVFLPSREAARVLCARAMFRLGAGKVEEAWQDLLACHRLARLMGQGPTLVDALVAIAIEGIAIHGDVVLAHEGKLTAEQAQRFAAEFRQLPPMGKMADKINWAERFFCLDCVEMATKEGPAQLLAYGDIVGGGKNRWAWLINAMARVFVDWDEPMRIGNQWYDRVVAALSKPTHKERATAVADLEHDLKQMSKEARDLRAILRSALSSGSLRFALSRMLAQTLVSDFLPALSAAMNAEERDITYQNMVPVVFALAAYRADRGAYPAELAALVPQYLPAIPEDLFSGGPFRYKREGAGYVLYSVGPNGKDDGGRNYMDEPDSEKNRGCDDIAIHVPLRERSRL